jgi:hypothetical protein
MAVVVNEFEVVPAPQVTTGPAPASPEPPSGPLTPASLREEIERTLRRLERRHRRLEAT